MKSSKQNNIIPKNLIGTSWISVETISEDKSAIEIIDEKYCIYSSQNKTKLRPYRISEDQIFIGDSVSYAIRDNAFFYNDTPLYVKEERSSIRSPDRT